MAAELEQLRKDVRALSKKFGDAGQNDLAALLDIDAQGFGTKAKIARARGVLTFASPTDKTVDSTPTNPYEQIQASLGLTPEQLAQHPDLITLDTKAYVGDLVHTDSQGRIVPILEKLADVEHIYNAEGKEIPTWNLGIGGITTQDYEQALASTPDITNGAGALSMVRHPDFDKDLLPKPTTVRLIMLDGHDVGYPMVVTTEQRFARGQKLGAKLCLPEIGPAQRIADTEQTINTAYWIAMKQIHISFGHPCVFELGRDSGGQWLFSDWAPSDGRWDPADRLVFVLPQVTSKP